MKTKLSVLIWAGLLVAAHAATAGVRVGFGVSAGAPVVYRTPVRVAVARPVYYPPARVYYASPAPYVPTVPMVPGREVVVRPASVWVALPPPCVVSTRVCLPFLGFSFRWGGGHCR
jgi:hypothetical protein